MAYQMAAMNNLEGHSPVAGLFKYNLSNICAAFYTISTDSVLARSLCISWASCCWACVHGMGIDVAGIIIDEKQVTVPFSRLVSRHAVQT